MGRLPPTTTLPPPPSGLSRRAVLAGLAALPACGGGDPPKASVPTAPTPEPTPDPDALARVRASGILRVGAESNSPPMLYAGANGQLTGFEHAVTQALAASLGLRAEFVLGTWADLPGALGKGAFDAVVAGWIPRAELAVSWSETYLESGLCLVVRKGSPVRSIADLAGQRVAHYPDPGVISWFKANLASSELVPATKGLYELVDSGDVAALIYDFPYVAAEIVPLRDRLRIVGLNLTRFGYSVMLPPGELGFVDAMNQAIRTVRATKEYGSWLRTWFHLDDLGTDVLDLGPPPPATPRTHTTRGWESLRDIARTLWKDEARWVDLWHANSGRIAFPELVPPETQLAVP